MDHEQRHPKLNQKCTFHRFKLITSGVLLKHQKTDCYTCTNGLSFKCPDKRVWGGLARDWTQELIHAGVFSVVDLHPQTLNGFSLESIAHFIPRRKEGNKSCGHILRMKLTLRPEVCLNFNCYLHVRPKQARICQVEHLPSMCRALGLILKKENNFSKKKYFKRSKESSSPMRKQCFQSKLKWLLTQGERLNDFLISHKCNLVTTNCS